MLRTNRILILSIVLSLTTLGLVIVYNGGCMAAQAGEYNSFSLCSAESKGDGGRAHGKASALLW